MALTDQFLAPAVRLSRTIVMVTAGLLCLAVVVAVSSIAAPSASPPVSAVPESDAVASALNRFTVGSSGIELSNPSHDVRFEGTGLEFVAPSGGPSWSWNLEFVGAASGGPLLIPPDAARPEYDGRSTVRYRRGDLIEQYVAKAGSIEQQFVLLRPFDLGGSDLLIRGAIASDGAFAATDDGWSWGSGSGAVTLGDVTVYDATGRTIPAEMIVSAVEARIVVDGAALAEAVYPVTIDPEIGTDDFRISDAGPDGNVVFEVENVAIAYNSTDNEYLVVWSTYDDAVGGLALGEVEIWGRRIDAANGALIGNDFRISDMGPDNSNLYRPFSPAIVYNSAQNEYLVVWFGDDNTAPLVDGEDEIFGQRINAATGAEVGANDFRISDMGPNGNVAFDAGSPSVAYSSVDGEYLVVWPGDDTVDNKNEIFAQRLDATDGTEKSSDFKVASLGPAADANYDTFSPDIAFNAIEDEYLVVWSGDDNTPPLVNDELEIFGRRVDGLTGAFPGNIFRISDMGPDGDPNYDAFVPAVAFNSRDNQYLVVWDGDDNTAPLVDSEGEVFGRRTAGGVDLPLGSDLRLSDMGPNGDDLYAGVFPDVAFDPAHREFLVAWYGDDDTAPYVEGEREIYTQRVSADGLEIGGDTRISDMGPPGDPDFDAAPPAIAVNGTDLEYLVVFASDDNTGGVVNMEFEAFGQRLAFPFFGYVPAVANSATPPW